MIAAAANFIRSELELQTTFSQGVLRGLERGFPFVCFQEKRL
jgi:hypothetical protein